MERILLTEEGVEKAAERAAAVIRGGGIVLYPTDTLYGLGADARSDDAVAKIYTIKGRDEGKPIHAIVDSIETAARFGAIDERVRILESKLPKGKVSFIVPKAFGEEGIGHGLNTFGFRIPDNAFCIAMTRAFGGPITATSANVAGEQPQRSIDAILNQFEHSHILEYMSMIDLIGDAGELPPSKPSTVVDLSHGDIRVLREGAVRVADITAALA